MNLAGRSFRAVANSDNGSLNTDTIMRFDRDADGLVTGTYEGGSIATGHVLARRLTDGSLDMLYQGATTSEQIQAGRASATFEDETGAGVTMHLAWCWLTGDRSAGQSRWMEVAG